MKISLKVVCACAALLTVGSTRADALYWCVDNPETDFSFDAARIRAEGGEPLELLYYNDSTASWEGSGLTTIKTTGGATGTLWADLGSNPDTTASFFIELVNYASGQTVGVSQAMSYNDLVSNGYISAPGFASAGSAVPWNGGQYAVPEPSSGVLLLLGIGGLLLRRKEGGVA